MTPAQIETAARNRYNAINDTFYSQDELFKVMYEAEMELSMETSCIQNTDTSISTVSGTQTYAIPTNEIAIKRITVNGNKLELIDQRDDDSITLDNADTTSTGRPQYYWIFNDTIYMRPIPDAVYTTEIFHFEEPVLLTTASTSMSVPSRYHTYIIDYVMAEMAAKDENTAFSDRYRARWDRHVNQARRYEAKRKRTDKFKVVKNSDEMAQTIIGIV